MNEREWKVTLPQWEAALANAFRLGQEAKRIATHLQPASVPTVRELDEVLRAVLPHNMVYAMRPTGDPYTGWARMMLEGTPSSPAQPSVEALAAALREGHWIGGISQRYGRFNDAYYEQSAQRLLTFALRFTTATPEAEG